VYCGTVSHPFFPSAHRGQRRYHVKKDGLETKEISYFAGISEEKIFEMSLIELPGYKLCIVCVYRSPDGQFDKFLNKLRVSYSEITNER
jgi:hypothetical protein